MRLVYLDEAGISNNGVENTVVVAGCLIDMDVCWRPLKRRFETLVERFVPADSRDGFVFHAKDIWHGAKVFDRQKYRDDRRDVLRSLCAVAAEFQLGIVYGFVRKDELATTMTELGEVHSPKLIGAMAYMGAFIEAVVQANKWMGRYAEKELCTVVVEDNDELRRLGKSAFSELRRGNVPTGVREAIPGLPFEYVLDEPSYMRKAGAPALQLADICAFLLRRWFDGKHDVDEFLALLRPTMIASRFTQEEIQALLLAERGKTGLES